MPRPLEVCSRCCGNGWILGGPRLTNDKWQCPRCKGTGYEPTNEQRKVLDYRSSWTGDGE
jgi:DnaJ-class molecular chaperone